MKSMARCAPSSRRASTLALVAFLPLLACSDAAEIVGGAAATAGDDAAGANGAVGGSGNGSAGRSGEPSGGPADAPPEGSDPDLMPAGAGANGLGGAPSAAGDAGAGGAGSGAGGAGGGGSADGVAANGGASSAPALPFIAPRGGCDVSTRVGRFSIEKQIDFGVVQGQVSDGVVPSTIPSVALDVTFDDAADEAAEEPLNPGRCRLLERRNLACLPACVSGETCGESGSCVPYPRQVSVGDVGITGLTRPTSMTPQIPGNTYFAPGADNPPFAVGSEVVLSAAGTEAASGFQLFGLGSEPLAQAPSWVLTERADLRLEWAAPTSAVATSVLVELTIDQHGSSPLSLSCEFRDTGSARVPADIVDRLLGAGISGFPNGKLTRRTADHVQFGAGCVELSVGSPLAASVSVSGYTPCDAAGDCPEGQTCNVPLQRCE
jgi:hypothetical protein